jgi:flavin reductase (DIM6/NTAB) family NADH-FMN oxidoreductase RutF
MTRPEARAELTPLARALGRVPTGLYIVSCQLDGVASGFLASFVVQCGFEPPTVVLAVGKDRPHLAALRAQRVFGVSILDAQSRSLMAPFMKSSTPFDGLATGTGPAGTLHLSEALAWLECRVRSEADAGDHVLVIATAEAGALLREGDPSVHLRKNGLSY